jgi:DNA mismatch repair protein MutS2
MNVTNRTLDELGWHVVVEAVAERCLSEPGRRAVLGFRFEPGLEPRGELSLVRELMTLIEQDGALPVDGLEDIRETVGLCERGGCAPSEDLHRVALTSRSLTRTRRRLLHHEETFQGLGTLGRGLPDVSEVEHYLRGLFDETGALRDDASPELQAACTKRASLVQRIKVRLEKYLLRENIADIAQDLYYTQRDDRFVLPIVSSFQSKLPGIIHGTSNSGETVYIEPESFVTANNELKLAEAEVRMRRLEVLRDASAEVGTRAADLTEGVARCAKLDAIQARARFGLDQGCAIPGFDQGSGLLLIQASNPILLLRGVEVVRNDIRLDGDARFIVLTGPNTGGKTVTLSTVGLHVLMAHAGIPIPAAEGSQVPRLSELFALIGDAQDIQRDLSTFSGHLAALGEVLGTASPGTLALLDELVVGTEPEAGAALAIAVMEALAEAGARGFVTTHYPRLKTLAFEDGRFVNASVGIEAGSMAPNFRLHMGSAGTSNPLTLAEQLGFPKAIVVRAREIAAGDADLAQALEHLELERAELSAQREAAREAERVSDEARERLTARLAALEARRKEAERTMEIEVRDAAEAALEEIRTQVREVQSEKDAGALERRRRKLVGIRDAASRGATEPSAPKAPHEGDLGDLLDAPSPGQAVWMRTLGKIAQVIEDRGETAVVAVGSLHMTVEHSDLGRAALPSSGPTSKSTRPEAARTSTLPVPQSTRNAIDLRGVRRDEMEAPLLAFVDRAFREGQRNVWVIHGMGTGALREEARSLLANISYVESYRAGDRHEGGDGATIAWLAERD